MATKNIFDASVEASRKNSTWVILPSKIRADHRNNASRSALYPMPAELKNLPEFGDMCCFTLPQIEKRLASLKAETQIQSVRGYNTATGHPVLKEGYLRHIAFCLAEVRGELADIPGSRVEGKKGKHYGIRIDIVPAPKSPEDQSAALWSNVEENDERLPRTPIDTAWAIKRALVLQDTKSTIATKLKMSERNVDRHLSLLALTPTIQLDIHEGRTTMSVALAKASERGEGTGRGKRAGVPHKQLRRAFEAIQDSGHAAELLESGTTFTVEEMLSALSWVAGVKNGEPPEAIKAFIEDAPPKPRGRAGRPRQAPPRISGKAAADDA